MFIVAHTEAAGFDNCVCMLVCKLFAIRLSFHMNIQLNKLLGLASLLTVTVFPAYTLPCHGGLLNAMHAFTACCTWFNADMCLLQFIATLFTNIEALTGSPVTCNITSFKSGSVVTTI